MKQIFYLLAGLLASSSFSFAQTITIGDPNYVYLRGGGDINHGLAWYGTTTGLSKPFAGILPDGPVLFGYSGGILGTKAGSEKAVIKWNAIGNVDINSQVAITGGGLWCNGTSGATPTTGAGTRLMWIPQKAAFRAGIISPGSLFPIAWDDANIGIASVAFGESCAATGNYAFSAGNYNIASGLKSTALGDQNQAQGNSSIALGSLTKSIGDYSFCGGKNSITNGAYSFSYGNGVTAQSYNSFVIGWASVNGSVSSTTWVPTDPLFVIGNNTSTNAFNVLKNGNTGIGSIAPTYKLEINAGTTSALLVKNAAGAAYGIRTQVLDNNIKAFVIENNGVEKFRINGGGTIYGKEIFLMYGAFPDYVFSKEYNLKSLDEVSDFIKMNNHLPNIPSADDVKENGIGTAELQVKLLEKIEELTLYIIDQEKRIKQLEAK